MVRCAREAILGADHNFFRPPSYYTLFALARTDAPAAIDEVYAVADRIAEGSGWPRAVAIMAMAHGLKAAHSGDLHEAARRFSTALESFEDYGIDVRGDHCAVTCAVWFTDVLASLGRMDEARELLSRHMRVQEEVPQILEYTFLLYARGRLRLAEGDARGAVEDLEECGRRAEAWQMRNPAILPWRSRAAAAHTALGQRERARELAEEDLALALAWGTDRVIGVAQHALAMAVGGSEGHELLKAAVARLAASPTASATPKRCWTWRRRCTRRAAPTRPAPSSTRRSRWRPRAAPGRWPGAGSSCSPGSAAGGARDAVRTLRSVSPRRSTRSGSPRHAAPPTARSRRTCA